MPSTLYDSHYPTPHIITAHDALHDSPSRILVVGGRQRIIKAEGKDFINTWDRPRA